MAFPLQRYRLSERSPLWTQWVDEPGLGGRLGPGSLSGTYCGEEDEVGRGSHLQLLGRSLGLESGEQCWGTSGPLPCDASAARDWIQLFLE